jgi:hypothetical protein
VGTAELAGGRRRARGDLLLTAAEAELGERDLAPEVDGDAVVLALGVPVVDGREATAAGGEIGERRRRAGREAEWDLAGGGDELGHAAFADGEELGAVVLE